MVLGQEEGQAKREEGGKEPVGSPWAVDGLDPPSAHAHQPSRHYFCWAWALGGVNGRSIIRRLSPYCPSHKILASVFVAVIIHSREVTALA